MRLPLRTVYLAGPMSGVSHAKSTFWREEVSNKLPDHICAVSPFRGKHHFLKNVVSIDDCYEGEDLGTAHAILTRDHLDCQNCDAIFVNLLGASTVSIGTVMEIAWGFAYRKPVVIAMEKEGNVHQHCMLNQSTPFISDTLDHAIHLLVTILTPSL